MSIAAIVIIVVFLAIFSAVGLYTAHRWRSIMREAKNYERGLKMVPLLIHLPPMSDDIEVGGRDARDVTEETIAKAESMYDIIASTATKGFKSKFYGQRHIAFEIVASRGVVYFYVAVPVALVGVVQQAVISAYPSARLEEVSEHNIFSPVGKLSGTLGGELTLKKDFMYPIDTFQDSRRDGMQSLLNSLSSLSNEDGAGIQIMIRPAHSGWEKRGIEFAKNKRDGKKKSGPGALLRDTVMALGKPPEHDNDKPAKQLSSLEQSEVDGIEEKTKHPAYETMVRVIVSSNTTHNAQAILSNMVASFSLFDAPSRNGFKYSEAKDIESFVTAYILRFFPPEANHSILNSVELATIFHFPDQRSTPTSQLERQGSKQVDGPRNMPNDGLLLGYNVFRGLKKEVRLDDNDRRRHMYIVGQTGVGKSVLLENLAVQDMLAGKGFAFVDPHGDTVDRLLGMVPKERTEDVIYFNPSEMDYPLGLNFFEFSLPEQKDFLIQESISMLYKLYDPQRQGIIGPRYEHWFRNAALTLMADPGGSTFIDIPKVFTDNNYAKQKLKHVTDQTVLDFWNKEMASTSDYHKSEILGWFVSKFGAFLSNEMMRNIIGQTKSSFNLREVMDEGKILLVNLSKGRTGELNSKLLGMIFVMKFQAAAMSRSTVPEDQRKDFSLYVDEFQNFSTDSFATILSEARKYRLNLIVANQFISQLSDEIRDAVFGNVGSIASFRTGATDAEFLVKQFHPTFDVDDLVKIPNFNTVMRLMVDNVPSQPFSMATLPPLGHENPQLAEALKKLSNAKYGRPRAKVEKDIFERLKTDEPARPAFGARPAGPPRPGQMPRRTPAGAGAGAPAQSSFLDEWLEKRRQRQAAQAGGAQSAGQAAKAKATPAKTPEQQPAIETKKPAFPEQQKTTVNQDIDNLFDKPKHSPQPAKKPSGSSQHVVQPLQSEPATSESKPTEKADQGSITGEQRDQVDIGNISSFLKKDLKDHSADTSKTATKDVRSGFNDDDELYIDKDGNVHFKNPSDDS